MEAFSAVLKVLRRDLHKAIGSERVVDSSRISWRRTASGLEILRAWAGPRADGTPDLWQSARTTRGREADDHRSLQMRLSGATRTRMLLPPLDRSIRFNPRT